MGGGGEKRERGSDGCFEGLYSPLNESQGVREARQLNSDTGEREGREEREHIQKEQSRAEQKAKLGNRKGKPFLFSPFFSSLLFWREECISCPCWGSPQT